MPLLWLSLSFLAGVVLGEVAAWPVRGWAAALAAVLLGRWAWGRVAARAPGLRFRPAASLPVPLRALAVAVVLGALRYQAAQPRLTPGFIAWYNDTGVEMAVVGVVSGPPDRRDTYLNLRVRVERVRPAATVVHTRARGTLLARLPPDGDWRYGDRVVLEGAIETPPEDEEFSYREYLARKGVYSLMPEATGARLDSGQGNPVLGAIYALQGRALQRVYELFPDPEASLMAGILLGVETGIPRAVQEAFKDTGTSHVIAISGFNITILAGLFATLFGRLLGPRRGAAAAVLGIAGYTVLVGADAAVVRAAIMGTLALLARQVGRRQAALNSLAVTAAVMALAQPQVLWDVGFQLSFMATIGLVLYADPLAQGFARAAARFVGERTAARLAGPAGEYFLFTLAAQWTTVPVTAYHFQRFSWSSLLANPAILPVQPAVMIVGGIALILDLIFPPLGAPVAAVAWPFVAYTIRVVERFARLPFGVVALGPLRLPWVVVYYGVLFGGTAFLARAAPRARAVAGQLAPGLPLGGLAALAVVTWQAALAAPDGRLHLTAFAVGSGEALLIETAGGHRLLVNGGPRASLLSDALGRRLPLGDRRLDLLVVAGVSGSQVGALPHSLARFPPERALWAGSSAGSRESRRLHAALLETGTPVVQLQAGQTLSLGEGAALETLAAGARGAVLLLSHGRFRAVLPVGMDFEALETLSADPSLRGVTVLMLADSGYAPLNPPDWIAHLRPGLVVLSVAADDYDGQPSPDTMEALEGYSVVRTDRNGWVRLSTDGERLWVEVERGDLR